LSGIENEGPIIISGQCPKQIPISALISKIFDMISVIIIIITSFASECNNCDPPMLNLRLLVDDEDEYTISEDEDFEHRKEDEAEKLNSVEIWNLAVAFKC
jgi:hypothetical protein